MTLCNGCNSTDTSGKLTCNVCEKAFHPECLKSGQPSPVEGDVFFTLTCADCHSSGEDLLKRIKLPWVTVIHLTLYNLQLHSTGKFGFFKWRDSIVTYIDRYWNTFFPYEKKKASYHGTVAGTLSNWSPQIFLSGSSTLGETGWWKLKENKPPTLAQVMQFQQKSAGRGKSAYKEPVSNIMTSGGGRSCRTRVSSIQAAIELKARRDQTFEVKEIKKRKSQEKAKKQMTVPGLDPCASSNIIGSKKIKIGGKYEHITDLLTKNPVQETQVSFTTRLTAAPSELKQSSIYSESVSHLLGDKESDSDLEIDPCALSPLALESPSESTSNLNFTSSMDMGQETGNTCQEWDQIMAPFCDSYNQVPDIAQTMEIKNEPFSEGYETAEMVELYPLGNVVATEEITLTTSLSREHSCDGQEFNFDNEVIKTEPDVNSRPNSSLGSSSAESEKEIGRVPYESAILQSDTESEISSYSSACLEKQTVKRSKIKQEEEITQQTEQTPKINYIGMSLYEEKQLLQRLQSMECQVNKDHAASRLRRKLLLREQKRKHGLPCFDLDSMMNRLAGQRSVLYGIQHAQTQEPTHTKTAPFSSPVKSADVRILDRFQTYHHIRRHATGASFLNKLVGTDDENLQCIRSPYTARLLKPFIRRDYESRPNKMKLLMEIQAYPHRNNPDWVSADPPPIDYCYVQPQHIPSVNSLCREFLWPGIDLSECLQYPDFSCVVLYRKFVIGFAFMVPDVKHNEAYISFIFTHPEWRGAGIAKFMVYHLIQTCMGKDITLHVSASNPAMLLYQKFGFKPEEFILDFYDKYFPAESKDSRHAFFLRLRR